MPRSYLGREIVSITSIVSSAAAASIAEPRAMA